jgi:hypothetical protein
VILLPLLAAAALSAPETRGRQIYLRGRSGRGTAITAVVSDGGAEVPATVMPCGSCHGPNGRGKPEGGVVPARIDWETLTRPLDGEGRKRPPYTEAMVRRAITMGIDSGAKELQSVMPRYRFRRDDIDDLVAYLRKLGNIAPPGVHDDVVRIGVAARDLVVLQEYGGTLRIYDRRLAFEPADRVDEADDLFAYIDVLDSAGDIPQLLATPGGVSPPQLGSGQFALFAGVAQQAAALVRTEAKRLPENQRTLAIVYRDSAWRDTAEELRALALANGWTSAIAGPSAAEARAVLLIDRAVPPEGRLVLLPAALADATVFDEQGQPRPNVVLAFPAEAIGNEAATFSERSTRIALALVVEALTRSGRDLTREAFITAIESIHDFSEANVSFSRAHHTGSADVVVVSRGEKGVETNRATP